MAFTKVSNLPLADISVANRVLTDSSKIQLVQLDVGAGATSSPVTSANPLPITISGAGTTGTFAAVNCSTTVATLAAVDSTRQGVTMVNASTATNIFVAYGFTATTANYSVKVGPGAYLEVPEHSKKLLITGICTAGSATANVTKVT